MTLLGMFCLFELFMVWIFTGANVISYFIDHKGYNISRYWEWSLLWPVGLLELLDVCKNP